MVRVVHKLSCEMADSRDGLCDATLGGAALAILVEMSTTDWRPDRIQVVGQARVSHTANEGDKNDDVWFRLRGLVLVVFCGMDKRPVECATTITTTATTMTTTRSRKVLGVGLTAVKVGLRNWEIDELVNGQQSASLESWRKSWRRGREQWEESSKGPARWG